jgi:methionine synthase I (cobalamin-dependent)
VKATGLPVVVSLVTDGRGKLLSGETIAEGARVLRAAGPDALGINCVPAARLGSDLAILAEAAPGLPLSAYANLGLPADDRGWKFTEELAPDAYAGLARAWLGLGARVVGGCCGTTPDHTRALRGLLDAEAANAAQAMSIASPNE